MYHLFRHFPYVHQTTHHTLDLLDTLDPYDIVYYYISRRQARHGKLSLGTQGHRQRME